MLPLVAALVAFALFVLLRALPGWALPWARHVGLGAILGATAGAAASVGLERLRVGLEETSAVLLLVAVGLWSVRWSVASSPAAGRRSSAHLATAALMGMAGAWAGHPQGFLAAALAGLATGAAAWALFAQKPHASALVAGAAAFAWPLVADRLEAARALQGFAALALGALLGWLSVAEARATPRDWPLVLLGVALGLAPRLLA